MTFFSFVQISVIPANIVPCNMHGLGCGMLCCQLFLMYACSLLWTEVFGVWVMHQETHREAGMVSFKKGGDDSSKDWKNQDFIASYRVSSDCISYPAIL